MVDTGIGIVLTYIIESNVKYVLHFHSRIHNATPKATIIVPILNKL